MKPLRYPVTADQAAYMRMRKQQNLAACRTNKNENWMAEKLKATGKKWSRQATWGYRLFDFWCHELGIAVEVDGPEHDIKYDNYRDEYNYRRSGIIVLRVPNLCEESAENALRVIAQTDSWAKRREDLGLNAKSKKERRKWVRGNEKAA